MPEHFEQAKALYDKGEYAAAKEVFEAALAEDESDARSWNGLGNAHLQAGEAEEAYEAYQQAIAWDDAYAPAWHGLGLSLELLENYPEAQEAFLQALRLDRDFANAWNALGSLYLSRQGRAEEGIRCFQRCEYLAEGRFAVNLFTLFSQLPNYPFFSWHAIRAYMPLKDYPQWPEYLLHTMADARPLLAYQNWLSYQNREGALSGAQWLLWAGLANLMMGNPAQGLEFLDGYQAQQNELSLMAAYYQLQACWDFHQPDADYLQPALEKAAAFLPPEQEGGWQFWKKKKEETPALQAGAYEDCYYAGLIYVYNDELDKALLCFERIEHQFLPAAYQALWLCEEMVQPKKKKEKAAIVLGLENKQQQFIHGIQPIKLLPDNPNPLKVLLPAVRYQELADAIEVLHLFAEFEGNPHDFEVLNSREQPPCHHLWVLSPENEQLILSSLREEWRKAALEQLQNNWPESPVQPADALHALNETTAGALPDKQLFFLLLGYYFVEKKLTEYDIILAGLYYELRASEPAEAVEPVETKDIQLPLLASDSWESALNEAGMMAGLPAFLHTYRARMAAGKLAELVEAFLKKATPYASFLYFREQFEAFIGEEKKGLEGFLFE